MAPAPAQLAQAHDNGKRTVKSELYCILANSCRWWSLPELTAELTARGLTALETSVSARLRELPNAYQCTMRSRVREGKTHLWEYAVGVEGVAG